MNKPSPKPAEGVMSLELLLTIGLPMLSIVVGSVMAFVAYTRGFTEVAQAPTAVVTQH